MHRHALRFKGKSYFIEEHFYWPTYHFFSPPGVYSDLVLRPVSILSSFWREHLTHQ